MGNFLATQNGQGPPLQMMNGDMGQNFPPMNVKKKNQYNFSFVI